MSRYNSKISLGSTSQTLGTSACKTCSGSCYGKCKGSCKTGCSAGCKAVCYIGVYKFLSLAEESDARSS